MNLMTMIINQVQNQGSCFERFFCALLYQCRDEYVNVVFSIACIVLSIVCTIVICKTNHVEIMIKKLSYIFLYRSCIRKYTLPISMFCTALEHNIITCFVLILKKLLHNNILTNQFQRFYPTS